MEVAHVELIATGVTMFGAGGSVAVFFLLRARDRRAVARDRALRSALRDLRGALIALPAPTRPRGGAVVDVEVGDPINHDTDSGRWLRGVLAAARHDESAAAFPRENRGLQRLRLVPRLPPPRRLDQGDDTPAPEAQREPPPPPPSSRSPKRPSRR